MSGPGKLLAGGRSRQRIKRSGIFHAPASRCRTTGIASSFSEGGFVPLKRFVPCSVRLRRASSNSTSLRRLPLRMGKRPPFCTTAPNISLRQSACAQSCASSFSKVLRRPFLYWTGTRLPFWWRSTISHLPDRPSRSDYTGSARGSVTPRATSYPGRSACSCARLPITVCSFSPHQPSMALSAARRGQ